eukprot:TRINITY_DN47370_c2_g1_i1.p1 TRINITY_DN47370_c2_g1~~TRINITY_DN47370_c2_g1_i1.p1  ORF type:complete len:366 (+),score=53.88 TRINITY_DN47370_c2_g1_i1:91-1098(+)
MLNTLEYGAKGVVLETEDPEEVDRVFEYVNNKNTQQQVQLSVASVESTTEVELSDRVCVDVCSMMTPGWGMLVGCFSRGLFLVHSECEEIIAKLGGIAIYAVVQSLEESKVMLNTLEYGAKGVVLETEDPEEVDRVFEYVNNKNTQQQVQLSVASVESTTEVELSDRVCVDVCSMMTPGWGMLVGCFSRGLFLVHSECEESQYINSRPFRVNAGAVSCYIQCPEGKTQYLSELKCGSQVQIVDVYGNQQVATVGRSKIESRPMVIVEASTDSGDRISVVVQKAETVQLVGPNNQEKSSWKTIPVTEIKSGDKVYVYCNVGARHTGILVDETIIEK